MNRLIARVYVSFIIFGGLAVTTSETAWGVLLHHQPISKVEFFIFAEIVSIVSAYLGFKLWYELK